MYRNISYSNRASSITYGTWDDDGNRVDRVKKFKPYIFLESDKGTPDAISIFNTNLRKKNLIQSQNEDNSLKSIEVGYFTIFQLNNSSF